MTNPFTVSKPVSLERFIGRKSEVETAFDQIFNRSNLAIWGGAGMGKTSLLKYVTTPDAWVMRGQDISKAAIAQVNCLTLEPFTAAKFWRAVVRSLQTQFGDEAFLDVLLQKEANTSEDVLAVLRELGKRNMYLVMLADDYDVALRQNSNAQYGEDDIEAFLSECRSMALADEGKYLSAIVTSSRRLSDISPKLTPDKSPWYNHYLFRQLKPLTETEVAALFAGIPITPAIQEGIREMAGGNPTLLQNAGYLLYEKLRDRKDGEKLDPAKFAEDFQSATLQIFEAIWDLSTPLEQNLMMLVALTELEGKISNKNFDLGDIKLVFSQKELELKVLVERGILRQIPIDDRIGYSFASSIMEWWVVKKILNSNEQELQDRQKIFLNLMSHKQAAALTKSIRWLWQNRDIVPSILEWAGKLAGAFRKGFTS